MVDGKINFIFAKFTICFNILQMYPMTPISDIVAKKRVMERALKLFFVKRCRWSAMCVVPQSSRVLRRSSPKYSHSTHAYAFEGKLSISLQI